MATDIKRTWYQHVDVEPIATGSAVDQEGQVMAAVMEAGVEKVKPATGGGDKIVGFALFRQQDVTSKPEVVDVVVPSTAPYTVQLEWGHLTDTRVYDIAAAADLVFNVAVGPGQYNHNFLTGLLTFNVAEKGKTMRVYLRRDLTLFESRQIYYQAPINFPDPNYFMAVGVGKGKGRIFTAYFDTDIVWDTATPTAGANGFITTGGSAIPGVRVVSVPTPNDPFLGLEFLV